jgi:hypothetical protein
MKKSDNGKLIMGNKLTKELRETLAKIQDPKKVITWDTIVLALATLGLFMATVALVWITSMNISVSRDMTAATKDMAEQTKRMADYTKENIDTIIEQFKIKSYPSFLIDISQCVFGSNGYEYNINFTNRGEITAYKTSILFVSVYEDQNGTPHFVNETSSYYKANKEMTTVDYETEILNGTIFQVVINGTYFNRYTLENLKKLLIFIRFKVPYDEKFSYLETAYIIKKPIKESKILAPYHLQELSKWDSESLLRVYHDVASKNEHKAKKFFNDYVIQKEAPAEKNGVRH